MVLAGEFRGFKLVTIPYALASLMGARPFLGYGGAIIPLRNNISRGTP